jgi:hypothetical protein
LNQCVLQYLNGLVAESKGGGVPNNE